MPVNGTSLPESKQYSTTPCGSQTCHRHLLASIPWKLLPHRRPHVHCARISTRRPRFANFGCHEHFSSPHILILFAAFVTLPPAIVAMAAADLTRRTAEAQAPRKARTGNVAEPKSASLMSMWLSLHIIFSGLISLWAIPVTRAAVSHECTTKISHNVGRLALRVQEAQR